LLRFIAGCGLLVLVVDMRRVRLLAEGQVITVGIWLATMENFLLHIWDVNLSYFIFFAGISRVQVYSIYCYGYCWLWPACSGD